MRFLVCLLVVTVLAIFAILTFQPASRELKELRKVEKAKEEEVARLTVQNEELRRELHLLKSDKFYLEKFARENYGLSKTNEFIFKFE